MARALLRELSMVQADCVVLATLITSELGPPETYNSFTGQITSDMSRSSFSAALMRCDSGEILWRNDVLLRSVATVSDDAYAESLRLLFGGRGEPS